MTGLLGPEVGYVDLLDFETTESMKREHAEGRSFNRTPLRPSAAGKCTRELFYELMMFHKKATYAVAVNKPEVHRLLSLGNPIETHIIRQFEQHLKMVQVKYKQQVLSFGQLQAANLTQMLEGSLDVCFWSEKWKCVVDFKSKKDKFSQVYKTQWDETSAKLARMQSVQAISEQAFWVEDLGEFLAELDDPFFEANFLQLNLYANSSFLKERGVDHAAIIQYCKNDSRLREIRFRPSVAVYEQVRTKFEKALAAVATGEASLAPQDHQLGSIKCAFCTFKAECWGGDPLRSYFKTLPEKKWPADTAKLGVQGQALEKLFSAWKGVENTEAEKAKIEKLIVKAMGDAEVARVRLEDGSVFEARYLKSPRPRFEIRRSKV